MSLSHKLTFPRGSMFCVPSFDEMTNLTPYFNHVIPAYAGIQTVSHSASQVEELYETGSHIPGLNCCLNSALEPRLAMCAVVSIS